MFSSRFVIGDEENKSWINSELFGYDDETKLTSISCRTFIQLNGRTNEIEKREVKEPIHRIQYTVNSSKPLKVSEGQFTKTYQLSPDWCYTILAGVQDRCLKYLLDTINRIEYSGKIYTLMDNVRQIVDNKLSKLNSEINSELQSISNNINAESSTERSEVAHHCRRILKLIADEVFPAKDELVNGRSVKEDAYMNRLLAFLEKKGKSMLIKNQIEYLSSYFGSIRELAGKGEHSDISKFEAEQIVINTYLIMSHILNLLDAPNANNLD